jgi:hypothetical protein
MQDIAGLRIVEDMTLAQQDALVERICDAFGTAEIQDRRRKPSYGYRAVHVLASVQGLRVEIQVRTPLQDVWAQVSEVLGDRWGRQTRYGQPPDDPGAEISPGGINRQEAIDSWRGISENIAVIEEARAEDANLDERVRRIELEIAELENEQEGGRLDREYEAVKASYAEAHADEASAKEELQRAEAQFLAMKEQLKVRLGELKERYAAGSQEVVARISERKESEERARATLQGLLDRLRGGPK